MPRSLEPIQPAIAWADPHMKKNRCLRKFRLDSSPI